MKGRGKKREGEEDKKVLYQTIRDKRKRGTYENEGEERKGKRRKTERWRWCII
jgi:hypothetical protein